MQIYKKKSLAPSFLGKRYNLKGQRGDKYFNFYLAIQKPFRLSLFHRNEDISFCYAND